jgi:hypothetical protein
MSGFADYNPAKDSLTINANTNPLRLTLSGIYKNNEFTGLSALEKESGQGKTSPFKLTATNDTVYATFSVVSQTARLKMPAKLLNESTGNYFSSVVWPSNIGNKKLDASLKRNISLLLNSKSADKDAAAILLAEKNKFVNEWNRANAKLKVSETKVMGLSLSQDVQQTIGVMYEDSRVITLAGFNYSYSGGAHGNYVTTVVNIDKRTGAKVKLSDILTPEGIQALPKILEAAVRTQYSFDKTKTLEENGLFVKKITPSDNFYIAKGNLGFIYSTYSILAYSYGEPNLLIPASAIEKYIKPSYKKQ